LKEKQHRVKLLTGREGVDLQKKGLFGVKNWETLHEGESSRGNFWKKMLQKVCWTNRTACPEKKGREKEKTNKKGATRVGEGKEEADFFGCKRKGNFSAEER